MENNTLVEDNIHTRIFGILHSISLLHNCSVAFYNAHLIKDTYPNDIISIAWKTNIFYNYLGIYSMYHHEGSIHQYISYKGQYSHHSLDKYFVYNPNMLKISVHNMVCMTSRE